MIRKAGGELLDPQVAHPREPLDLLGHVPTQDLVDDRREHDSAAALLLGSPSTTTQLLGRPSHVRGLCHILLAGLLLLPALLPLALGGCASKVGWSITDEARTCSPKDPARVCGLAEPDFGHTLELGDARLLPGECAALNDSGRGGLIRVETRDPRGELRRSLIRAPRSKVTVIELREDGRAKVVERRGCDRMPVSLER